MADYAAAGYPTPETADLGRYLEDTITIDWQTPIVSECARARLVGLNTAEARVRSLFEFVRDEIGHVQDRPLPDRRGALDPPARAGGEPAPACAEASSDCDLPVTCRASEVLRARSGLCFAKSHLLAGLLRFAGIPAGFCYARLCDAARPAGFVLHGFNAAYLVSDDRGAGREHDGGWILLDARGNRPGIETECRFAPPWSLAHPIDEDRGESILPLIYKRPARRILDLLERAPDLGAVVRGLPDSL